jgi:hypothetical protein
MNQAKLLPIVLLASLVASTSARTPPTSLFDEYRAHDFARFESDLSATTDFVPLVDEATAASSSWPADVGAAYLLEVSAAAMHAEIYPKLTGPPGSGARGSLSYSGGPFRTDLLTDWRSLLQLSEQGAARIPPDSPAARAWGRSFMALLTGASEVSPQTSTSVVVDLVERLPQSTRDRIDDETLLMARGSAYEAVVATTLSYDLPALLGDERSTSDTRDVGTNYPAVRGTLVRAFNEGMKAFLGGMSYPDTRAEAAVRLGGLAMLRDQPGDLVFALSHLALARTWKPAPDVLYATWVLEGQAHRLLGEAGKATDAFAHAAALAPNGSAARLGLAVQAFLAGDSAKADQLSQQMLDMPAGADDPWILFQHGDYRHWAQRVDALRKALR